MERLVVSFICTSFLDSRFLSRLGRPVGHCNAELLCVLGIQSSPTAELHRLRASDASDGVAGENPIQHIETNVPAGSAHRDEAAIYLGPQCETRAAANSFEFPPGIVILEHFRSIGSRHSGFERRGRTHPGELHSSNFTQASIGVERWPLAQMRRVGKRLP